MTFERVHYLPLVITVLFPVTFIMTYLIAVINEDVTPLFPYISDTGTLSPESCIFGQMLNLGALFMAAVSYVRYLQLCDLVENNPLHERVEKWNWPSCVMGIIAAFGISIVGNFQEENALSTHLTGACLAFGIGGVYICMQSYIAFKIQPLLGNTTLNWIRVVLAAGTIIFFFTTLIFAVIAYENGPFPEDSESKIHMKWKPEEPGWTLHFISALSEWILAICLLSFLASFVDDFKYLSITPPRASNKLK